MKRIKYGKIAVVLALLAALYLIPLFVTNQYVLRVAVYVCIYSTLACSLNLISYVDRFPWDTRHFTGSALTPRLWWPSISGCLG